MDAPRKRLSHAERTRAEILESAVRIAAKEGLEGLTIGRLSAEVGMSKGGLFAHFGSKEALQIATVDAAAAEFVNEVSVPAQTEPPGVPQLRAMIQRYFDYVRSRAETGGCFFTAASVEFDDRPGPVRERVAAVLEARNASIEAMLRQACHGRVNEDDLRQVTFEVIALALGANVEFQLRKDPTVFDRAQTALERRLEEEFPNARSRPAPGVRSKRSASRSATKPERRAR